MAQWRVSAPVAERTGADRDRARPLVVVTNTRWFDRGFLPDVEAVVRRTRTGKGSLTALWRDMLGADATVINVESRLLFAACLWRRLAGRRAGRLVAVDVILGRPAGWRGRIRTAVIRWLLRGADRVVLYYRDTRVLRELYDLPAERVVYVPFKVNGIERLRTQAVRDEGFVLALGRSRRDYVTFGDAMRGLDARATILAHVGAETEAHGAEIDVDRLPPNVTVVADDGSFESWLDWLSRCRLVVLPIVPDTLAPSGIGAYLNAMALGKAVVITRSPATEGILTDAEAVVVPPRDAAAMRAAIVRLLDDAAERERVAGGGRRYALSLGGEERLAADIVALVERLCRGERA
jgi:glycosyltransferase involved in cell wall biosynthesis